MFAVTHTSVGDLYFHVGCFLIPYFIAASTRRKGQGNFFYLSFNSFIKWDELSLYILAGLQYFSIRSSVTNLYIMVMDLVQYELLLL